MTSPSKPVPDNGGDSLKRNPLRGASKAARPGADCAHSLRLLTDFKAAHPRVPARSGPIPGPGESDGAIVHVASGPPVHSSCHAGRRARGR